MGLPEIVNVRVKKAKIIPIVTPYKKVGVKYPPNGDRDIPVTQWKNFLYNHVAVDEDGWADCNKYLPADYDLVLVKVEGKPVMAGWISGVEWDGLKLQSNDKVKYWKRKEEHALVDRK